MFTKLNCFCASGTGRKLGLLVLLIIMLPYRIFPEEVSYSLFSNRYFSAVESDDWLEFKRKYSRYHLLSLQSYASSNPKDI